MGRFDGKTVLITGGSKGIGLAAAHRFAAEGATLVLAARGVEALREAAEAVGGHAVPTDVADPQARRDLVDAAVSATGRLDVLVNNAGLHVRGPTLDRTPEDLARMVTVNLAAPIALSRLALPHLIAAGGGAIVQVASLAGMVPVPGAATYSGTKAGLRLFSRALADEVAEHGITVTSVNPGPVATDFLLGHLDDVADITFSQPMSTPDQVAVEVVEAAAEGGLERSIPRRSGVLATVGYVLPAVHRWLRPRLAERGRRVKGGLG